ncbi:MAG TPA: hypothetical protein VHA56_11530 [Mucilaginibacter sp.]|nr:hypothetical protein [Mucilaginibacter sp.]
MRFTLLLICCAFSIPASAQWYRVDLLFKSHKRLPLIEEAAVNSTSMIALKADLMPVALRNFQLTRSEYSFQAAEHIVMRNAQHNMRFRIYSDASYNFSELANLYIQQNRYSEAKWYLLQSNIISRQQNDDKHTINNLMALAIIKSELGDFNQAQQDLTEAHDMALTRGFADDLKAIDKKMAFIKLNKNNAPRTDLRYAEAPATDSKAE